MEDLVFVITGIWQASQDSKYCLSGITHDVGVRLQGGSRRVAQAESYLQQWISPRILHTPGTPASVSLPARCYPSVPKLRALPLLG